MSEIDESEIDELEEDSLELNQEVKSTNVKYTIIERDSKKKITSEYFSLFEYVQVVCVRSVQLSKGAVSYINTPLNNTIDIARQEIKERKCPLAIYRPRGEDNNFIYEEYWNVNDLIVNNKCEETSTEFISTYEHEPIKLKIEKLIN